METFKKKTKIKYECFGQSLIKNKLIRSINKINLKRKNFQQKNKEII